VKEWVTLKEAALLISDDLTKPRPPWTISRWIKAGRLDSLKIGPSICVRAADVLRVEAELFKKKHRLGD
jgi:hypothetical protein